jgi:hypothetical protein
MQNGKMRKQVYYTYYDPDSQWSKIYLEWCV